MVFYPNVLSKKPNLPKPSPPIVKGQQRSKLKLSRNTFNEIEDLWDPTINTLNVQVKTKYF